MWLEGIFQVDSTLQNRLNSFTLESNVYVVKRKPSTEWRIKYFSMYHVCVSPYIMNISNGGTKYVL